MPLKAGNSSSNQQQLQVTTGASQPVYKPSSPSSSSNPPTFKPSGSLPDNNASQIGIWWIWSPPSSSSSLLGNSTSGDVSDSQSAEQSTGHSISVTPAATRGGLFGQPAQQPQLQSVSGGLFGLKPFPSSGRFDSSKQPQSAVPYGQSTGFGGQTQP